jgi:hypothetical protein
MNASLVGGGDRCRPLRATPQEPVPDGDRAAPTVTGRTDGLGERQTPGRGDDVGA